MITARRSPDNPLVGPQKERSWEADATFNPSVVKTPQGYVMLYRAMSGRQLLQGVDMNVSTIGLAESQDPVHFHKRRQLLTPQYFWEKFGVEDPRVTFIDGKYYIFYTALSSWPPSASDIKIGVAVTADFTTIDEKHLVTPFNAKAAVLFPEKINGKYALLLTAHTDMPPAKICLAQFDRIEDLWSEVYWKDWYADLDSHVVDIEKGDNDQLEVGAVPIRVKDGWLFIYSFIQNYFAGQRIFRIDAAILDSHKPQQVLTQTSEPLLVPEVEYELYGQVPNIAFPTSAVVEGDALHIYYGAADTSSCVATLSLEALLEELSPVATIGVKKGSRTLVKFERFSGNPIIAPKSEHPWESKYTFNAAAVSEAGKVHILYRAMGQEGTSVLGYASSSDGYQITERSADPVYMPRETFESKLAKGDSGCEDPRITRIGDTFYMCYTAFDTKNPPRVAFTSIAVSDFLSKKWNWKKPVVISPPGDDDKNACVLPEKINGRYVFFHRINPSIWVDFVEDLTFDEGEYIGGHILVTPRPNAWDSDKVGIGPPPIKTPYGWLLIYHGLSKYDRKYRLGAMLLDPGNPLKILSRLHHPILEPEMPYENTGLRPGTVFSCGAVVLEDKLIVYYGGADQVVCAASTSSSGLLTLLRRGLK